MPFHRRLSAIFLVMLSALAMGADASKTGGKKSANSAKHNADYLVSSNFFAGPIQRIDIEISAPDIGKMNRGNGFNGKRAQVPATIRMGTNTYEKVAIHLKGAAGSFRPIEDSHPAFTLNFGKIKEDQKFEGMKKIHLNNSVQDPSRLSELMCGEMYRRAGVPATRATHAIVTLNGRDLGLYVLKEGFDKPFLRRHFGDPSGNLYDGGFVQDVDADLERDSGEGPDNKADLRQLFDAAMEQRPDVRLQKLDQILDIDKFLTLTALQFIFDDWEGYVRNRNNYRIYHDPTSNKLVFLPHGMDQMFQNPDSPLLQAPNSIVARQLFMIPDMRSKLRERIQLMTNTVFTSAAVEEILEPAKARLAVGLADRKKEAASVRQAGNHFQSRVTSRLVKITGVPPSPIKFDANREFQLAGKPWVEHEGNGATLSLSRENGRQFITIAAEQPGSIGSFRTSVFLPAGVYRFEGLGRAEGVEATKSARGIGAGIRISREARANRLLGTTEWTPVSHDFEIVNQGEVQLVVELRANQGKVTYDLSTLKLRRL